MGGEGGCHTVSGVVRGEEGGKRATHSTRSAPCAHVQTHRSPRPSQTTTLTDLAPGRKKGKNSTGASERKGEQRTSLAQWSGDISSTRREWPIARVTEEIDRARNQQQHGWSSSSSMHSSVCHVWEPCRLEGKQRKLEAGRPSKGATSDCAVYVRGEVPRPSPANCRPTQTEERTRGARRRSRGWWAMSTVVHPERSRRSEEARLAAPKRRNRGPLATRWSSVSHRTARSWRGRCALFGGVVALPVRGGKKDRTARSESHKASGQKPGDVSGTAHILAWPSFHFIFSSSALNRAESALRDAIRINSKLVADSPEPPPKTCSSGARTWETTDPPYCGGSRRQFSAQTHVSRLHQNPNHG